MKEYKDLKDWVHWMRRSEDLSEHDTLFVKEVEDAISQVSNFRVLAETRAERIESLKQRLDRAVEDRDEILQVCANVYATLQTLDPSDDKMFARTIGRLDDLSLRWRCSECQHKNPDRDAIMLVTLTQCDRCWAPRP